MLLNIYELRQTYFSTIYVGASSVNQTHIANFLTSIKYLFLVFAVSVGTKYAICGRCIVSVANNLTFSYAR